MYHKRLYIINITDLKGCKAWADRLYFQNTVLNTKNKGFTIYLRRVVACQNNPIQLFGFQICLEANSVAF